MPARPRHVCWASIRWVGLIAGDDAAGSDAPALAPIEDRLDYLLSSTQKKRAHARKMSALFFVGQASAATITTVLVGLGEIDGVSLTGAALCTSATAAFLAVLQGYFGFRDRWRHFTSQVYGFYSIQAEIARLRAFAGQYGEPIVRSDIEAVYKRLDAILKSGIERWDSIANSKEAAKAIADATPETK